MGTFVETAWRCVRWIGRCIYTVVKWWGPFMEGVNQTVHAFLMLKRYIIERSDNPKTVGEVVAINKEKGELEKKADNLYRTLSNYDRNVVDDLLRERNY